MVSSSYGSPEQAANVPRTRPSNDGRSAAGSWQNGVVPAPSTLEPTVVREPDLDEAPAADHPWIVIVWNDPVNAMSYVTWVFKKLFGYSTEKATELMLDVHHKGKAVVANG
ncbi:MAG: ATP-dependent Clp protease adapter ClpS, partial [Ilumatobacter sp.]|nr:ATP-dependent Clp protease adapter ClpS [Ilumatobacter sp.]